VPIDLDELGRRIDEHGRIARVTIAETSGSVPRESGAAMLVWPDGLSGTIGGGALEFDAAALAREALGKPMSFAQVGRKPLGPGLGQCCGGSVTLVIETFDRTGLNKVMAAIGDSACHLRRVCEEAAATPDTIRRATEGEPERTHFLEGWLSEPVAMAKRPIWLFGAGHVGRAVVSVLEPTGEFEIVWIDMSADRFPSMVPSGVRQFLAENPADATTYAPANAEHLIMTHSHALDLQICSRILAIPFRSAGLIGSKSKWVRFRKRLSEAGFDEETIDRITCPIGIPELGKHPHAIAIGLACRLLGRGLPGNNPPTARR